MAQRNEKAPAGASLAPRQLQSRNSDLSELSSSCEANGEQRRKLAPNKAQVGVAKSPDLKNCKSKVGSLHNIKHSPAGGKVEIQTQKLNWNAKSKVGSLENREHKPTGGNVKVETRKLEWKTTSKIQSLENIKHKPGGGNVKIFNDSYRDKSTPKSVGGAQRDTPISSQVEQSKSSSNSDGCRSDANSSTKTKLATDKIARGIRGMNLSDKQ